MGFQSFLIFEKDCDVPGPGIANSLIRSDQIQSCHHVRIQVLRYHNTSALQLRFIKDKITEA
jgi:hypothetical protein